MKRQIILRGILGIPVGITIGYLIAIVISFIWAEGYYAPCAPDLVEAMGNEINGVILQTLLSGLLGAGFAAGSVIWEIESWSIVKQTAVYFGIVSVIMMSVLDGAQHSRFYQLLWHFRPDLRGNLGDRVRDWQVYGEKNERGLIADEKRRGKGRGRMNGFSFGRLIPAIQIFRKPVPILMFGKKIPL